MREERGLPMVYKSLKDILEPEVYHNFLEDIFRKEFLRGYEEAVEIGFVHGQYETLINFLRVRFPETLALIKQEIYSIEDSEVLRTLLLKVFAAQTAEEVKQILLEVSQQ